MSREHLWPRWAAPLLGGFPHSDHQDISVSRGSPRFRLRQGAVTTTKFKVVCRSCNNGWMGQLEQHVRPSLEPMIRGDSVSLSRAAQRTLAHWILLKVMVADCELPHDAVFSPADRQAFHAQRAFPPDVEIWTFKCGDGRWQSGFRRQSATLSWTPITPSITRHPNVCGTLFGLGSALFYLTVSKSVELAVHSRFDDGQRLYPFDADVFGWPPARSLTVADADAISETMARIKANTPGRWHEV